jgi:hypothetical protein
MLSIRIFIMKKHAKSKKYIFHIRNVFLKSYQLDELLHYSTYQNTNISAEILERMKSWSRSGCNVNEIYRIYSE